MLKKFLLFTMLVLSNNLNIIATEIVITPYCENYFTMLSQHSDNLTCYVRKGTEPYTLFGSLFLLPLLQEARAKKGIESEQLTIKIDLLTRKKTYRLDITLKTT